MNKMLKVFSFVEQQLLLLILIVAFMSIPQFARASGGASTYEIGFSTPANTWTQVAVGPGSLYDVVIATGAAGDSTVCVDSGTAPSTTNTGVVGTATAPVVDRLTVAATNTTTATPPSIVTRAFKNGLACLKSATGDAVSVLWTP